MQTLVDRDDPAQAVADLRELVGAGAAHLVLAPRAPFPAGIVRWMVDAVVKPVLDAVG